MIAVLNYLAGFRSCAILTEHATGGNAPFLLPKENFSVFQVVRVVDKYIADHPERMNDPPGVIVSNALNQGFPNKAFKKPDN